MNAFTLAITTFFTSISRAFTLIDEVTRSLLGLATAARVQSEHLATQSERDVQLKKLQADAKYRMEAERIEREVALMLAAAKVSMPAAPALPAPADTTTTTAAAQA